MASGQDLADRVVVVTGGLGRLGSSFSRVLAENGARVAVLDAKAGPKRRPPLLAGLGEDRLRVFEADVTSRSALEDVRQQVEAAWGPVFGLINNAAIDAPPDAPVSENGPFEDYSEASFDRMMDVNVKGVLLCCQVFGGGMAAAGAGSIVNIGSIYGILSPDQALYQYRRDRGETFFKPVAYSVSKSALMNLTRYLAVYWGRSGVRVNTLVFAGVFADQDPEFLKAYLPKIPLGRMAEPADYDGPVVFLMSDAARYMTGSTMVVDGGFSAM